MSEELAKLVGYLFSFVSGNVGGEYVEKVSLETRNTWFNPDPVTSGRIMCLVSGIPTAIVGLIASVVAKKKARYIAELIASAGVGIAANGISDLVMYGVPETHT